MLVRTNERAHLEELSCNAYNVLPAVVLCVKALQGTLSSRKDE